LARMTPHHCEHCLGAAFPDLVSACGPTRTALSTAYGGLVFWAASAPSRTRSRLARGRNGAHQDSRAAERDASAEPVQAPHTQHSRPATTRPNARARIHACLRHRSAGGAVGPLRRLRRTFVRASTRRRMAGAAGHPAVICRGHYDRCVCRCRRTTRRRRCRFARERRRAQWRVVTTSAHICPRRYRPSAPGRALRAQRDRAGAHAVRAQLELRERVIAAQRCCERLGASRLDLVAVEEERRKPTHARSRCMRRRCAACGIPCRTFGGVSLRAPRAGTEPLLACACCEAAPSPASDARPRTAPSEPPPRGSEGRAAVLGWAHGMRGQATARARRAAAQRERERLGAFVAKLVR
jgi:hypothetical protein